MTVSTEVSHNEYLGNGVTTSFPYTFRIFTDDNLEVSTVTGDGLVTVMILGTDYTVTGAGSYSGGNVVTSTPVASGVTISITRNLPAVQETDLRNQGKFFAEVHEDAFDYLTMLIQHAMYNVGVLQRNTLRVPEASVNLVPKVSSRRNMLFGWDNNGQPIAILPPSASASEVLLLLAQPDGWTRIGGAASAASVNDLSAKVEDRNYPKYSHAAEFAKKLADGQTFIVDGNGDSTFYGTIPNTGGQDADNPLATFKTTIANLYGVVLTVNNNAIPGTSLAQMLAGTDVSTTNPVPFETRVAASNASVVFCNHCINDSQLNNDIHQYRLNLIEFVRLCRKYNKVPILCTPNINPMAVGGSIITETKSKRLEKYVAVMRSVAAAVDCDLVDNFYYFTKTTRMVSPQVLVPDGAHPSTDGYKMAGRNLAIPFVSAKTLYSAWDKAGLANSTYIDNIATNRVYSENGAFFYRFNGGLIGTRGTSATGINMAVILDNPTDDTVLAVYGPQWNTGTKSAVTMNGTTLDNQFNGYINQNVFLSPLEWEGTYIPEKCKMYAGLHVVGITSQTSFGGSGTDFGMCGVGLVPRVTTMPSLSSVTELRNYPVICAQAVVNFSLHLFALGTVLSIFDCSNNTNRINIDWAGNAAALSIAANGSSYTIAPSVTTGSYYCMLKFNLDMTITVTVGAITITVPAGTTAYPNMYIKTQGIIHSIKYPV